MIIIGLTGSIGMGKSTTAGLFVAAGIPVNDADVVVHDLYRGEAVAAVEAAFPGSTKDGAVDRRELSRRLSETPAKFKMLEAIVHPLVRQRELEFVTSHRLAGAEMIVLDIPLLFETGGIDRVDVVVVVSCDALLQRQRVLARPNMTVEKYELILSRQTPDSDKRAGADYIVDTGHGIDMARKRVADIIASLRAGYRKDPTTHA